MSGTNGGGAAGDYMANRQSVAWVDGLAADAGGASQLDSHREEDEEPEEVPAAEEMAPDDPVVEDLLASIDLATSASYAFRHVGG